MENLATVNGATGKSSTGIVPDDGIEGDLWVDEDNALNRCSTPYTTGETSFTMTSGRVAPLVFVGVDQNMYIEVAVNDSGASGTSVVNMTGLGTFASPYLYVFDLYDDNASNDDIIALLPADLHLTATGADATNVSVVAYGSTPLSRTSESNWTAISIDMRYKAELPDFYSVTEELHPSISNPMRSGEALAKLATANLLTYARANPNTVNAFRQEGMAILSENLHQTNRRLGPVSFKAGYRTRR